MEIINLTPHPVRFIFTSENGEEQEVVYPSMGSLRSEILKHKQIMLQDSVHKIEIPVTQGVEYSPVIMPYISPNCIYIVSSMVKEAINAWYPSFASLFMVPSDIVRNKNGEIIGCKGFRI